MSLKRLIYRGDKYNSGGGWFVVCLLVTLLFCRYINKNKEKGYWGLFKQYIPFFMGCVFVMISMQHALWAHYYEPCSLLWIFAIITLLKCFTKNAQNALEKSKLFPVVIFLAFFYWNHAYRLPNFFTQCLDSEGYYAASSIASQIDTPKILSFGQESGIGLFSNSLPACKYWIRQAGSTPEMDNEQMMAFKSHQADIVTVYRGQEMDDIAKEAGYEKYDVGHNFGYIIYSKSGLKVSYRTPTKLQRLAKKNIFKD